MTRFVRKQTVIIATLTLALGLAIGLAAGSLVHPPQSAHAAGANGAIEIFPDGSLSACTAVICTQQPAGTCIADGSTGAETCNFATTPHSGGVIEQSGVAECFFIQTSGSYFTSFNSDIVYAPSGQVHIRCER